MSRSKLQAQEIEEGNHHFRVPRRIRRMRQNGQLGCVIQDGIEHIRRVADRGRDHLGAILGELIGGPTVAGHAQVAEVAGEGGRLTDLPGDRDALPSEDDRVSPPQRWLSGNRWWKLTKALVAAVSVSSHKYQVVHQASRSAGISAIWAMRANPKLQPCARRAA